MARLDREHITRWGFVRPDEEDWRTAAEEYVDTGDDTDLRWLVEQSRNEDERQVRKAQKDARDLKTAVAEFDRLLATRTPTGYTNKNAKKWERKNHPEHRYWNNMPTYEPEYACAVYCTRLALWVHPDGKKYCTQHSQKVLAEEAGMSLRPKGWVPERDVLTAWREQHKD